MGIAITLIVFAELYYLLKFHPVVTIAVIGISAVIVAAAALWTIFNEHLIPEGDYES
jgi:drug/metabolite transporter (DMT)-like permease